MPFRTLFLLVLLFTHSNAAAQDRNWQEVELRGVYVFGHATSTLEPCSSGQPMWLDGNSQASLDLDAAYDSLVNEHFEPLFVVVRGKLDADWDIGDYYVGRFLIEDLIEYSADPGVISDCQSHAATD